MADDFDPYYKWLGIPPEEQPPNHYRLLGLAKYETDADVVENAVDQRMSHIRSFQSGKRSAESQKILNALSAARGCLLDPAKKTAYDQRLQAEEAASQPVLMYEAPPGLPVPLPVRANPMSPMASYAPVPERHAGYGAPVVVHRGRPHTGANSLLIPLLLLGGLGVLFFFVVGGAVVALVVMRKAEVATDGDSSMVVKTPTDPVEPTEGGNNTTPVRPELPVIPPTSTVAATGQYALKFAGNPGEAVVFANSNDAFRWSRPTTVEMWYRCDVLPSNAAAVFLGQWEVDPQSSSPTIWKRGWYLFGTLNELRINYGGDGKGGAFPLRSAVSIGTWHHLAWCLNDDSLSVFLDGQPTYTRLESVDLDPLRALGDHSLPLSLGVPGSIPGQATFFGQIRGFRVSSSAKYSAPFTPPDRLPREADTEILLDFSQPRANLIMDLSGKGHHGAVTGAQWVRLSEVKPEIVVTSDGQDNRRTLWRSTGVSGPTFRKAAAGWINERQPSEGPLREVARTDEYIEIAAPDLIHRRLTADRMLISQGPDGPWRPSFPGTWIDEGSMGPGVAVSSADDPILTLAAGQQFGAPIDLLRTIDPTENIALPPPARGVFPGTLEMRGGVLVTEVSKTALVKIPVEAPSNYVLESVVTRVAGDESIAFGLVVGGQPCMFTIDAFKPLGYLAGLDMVDGRRLDMTNTTTPFRGPLLTNGRPATVRVRVVDNSVTASVDGKQIVSWQGDPSRLSLYPMYEIPDYDGLRLSTWLGGYEISKLELRPIISGTSPPSVPPVVTPFAKKLPVPDAAARTAALQEVRSVFGSEFSKAQKPEEKEKLAKELLDLANENKEKDATRFVLFEESRKLAVDAGKVLLAFDAAQSQIDAFDVDVWQIKPELLKKVAESVRTNDERKLMAEKAMEVIDESTLDGRFDVAIEASQIAVAAATKLGDPALRISTRKRREEVDELKKQWDAAQVASETLKTSPDDPAANLAWGKFVCLVRDDWEQGLPHLAKSSDPLLKTAAAKDQSNPKTADEQAAVGDAWWDAAQKASDAEKQPLLSRALIWYGRAAPFSAGLTKLRVDKRIEEINSQIVAKGGNKFGIPGNLGPEYLGMVGRVASRRADIGVVATYQLGTEIRGSSVYRLLNNNYASYQIQLAGLLHVGKATKVSIRHVGGSASSGVLTLSVDGTVLGQVGGNLAQDTTYEIQLTAGEHRVQWLLEGGFLGNCRLEFTAADGQKLILYHDKELAKAAAALPTRSVAPLGE